MSDQPIDRKAVVDAIAWAARNSYAAGLPGKTAINVPIESLHFYKNDGDELKCVIDMEQIVFLADDILRTALKP